MRDEHAACNEALDRVHRACIERCAVQRVIKRSAAENGNFLYEVLKVVDVLATNDGLRIVVE